MGINSGFKGLMCTNLGLLATQCKGKAMSLYGSTRQLRIRYHNLFQRHQIPFSWSARKKITNSHEMLASGLRNIWQELRPGTDYPHVTWAHVMLRVKLRCERRFNIEFYGANWHFCHSAYVTWSHVELWSAHVPARLWEAYWHVCRPELHVRSRDVSRVTEVWICAIEFNVKSPLTPQPHA